MQTTETPVIDAPHRALQECAEMFRAVIYALENDGDPWTLADIGRRIADAAVEALKPSD
ncbi:MAG TPA: hypothetical protein PKC03_15280 [Dokdonella sp.]|nr:hypothetical protein [Dokdonella sp.]